MKDSLAVRTLRAMLSRVSGVGLFLAAFFFMASLSPSLIPRDPGFQGLVGGTVAAIGYWIALSARWFSDWLGLPASRLGRHQLLRRTFMAAAALVFLYGLWNAADWQNAVRSVAGMEPVATSHPLTIVAVGSATFVTLLFLGFLAVGVARIAARALGRALPEKIAITLGVVVSAYLIWAVAEGVLWQRTFATVDASLAAADAMFEPDVAAPTDPGKTGSADSLVNWEDLGRWGRSFVTSAPTAEEIAAFHDSPVKTPVRVYVGRRSAETEAERADLALRELIRQGGFDRKVLIVAVPPGTGWMDPGAADTIDFLQGGDVATVAVQYSYLSSILALVVHPEYGVEQGRVLFDRIYEYWSTLPPDRRPAFYVHGLSQGAHNMQYALRLLDILADPIQGALYVGSPFLSPIWARVRSDREPGSPIWRPRFGNDSLVRVQTQFGSIDDPKAPWGPVRIVFLNYASDPIVNFDFSLGFRRPDWLKGDRAPDIPPAMGWYPVVTMLQVAVDMTISLAAPRHGHFYVAEDYADAWAETTAVDGWTSERAAELRRILESRDPPW